MKLIRKTAIHGAWLGAVISATLMFTGCKAKEASTTGFIANPDLMAKDETTPFQRTYWNKKFEKSRYTEVYVAPVNTSYIMAENLWEKASAVSVSREQLTKDVAMMAEYTRQSLIRAVTDDPNKRFKVVDKPGPHTLILELALTQLVPSKAVMNALGYVTWIPTAVSISGSMATGSQDTGKGVVAIEGRVRDGASGEIIGMFADCEFPKTAIIDIQSMNWWSPAKAIIDDWAKQLVQLANRRPGAVVKDTPTFDLLVW